MGTDIHELTTQQKDLTLKANINRGSQGWNMEDVVGETIIISLETIDCFKNSTLDK